MSWEVLLTGDATDLRILADTLKDGEFQVTKDGQAYVFRSTRFASLDSAAAVRECAIELVTALSGSTRLELSARQGIGVGAPVFWVRPDGKRDTTVLVSPAVTYERAMPLIALNGATIHRPADPIARWLPLVSHDPAVTKALRLRNADDLDWVDLSRLYEVIEHDVGSLIHQLGWASKNECSIFTGTANSVAAVGDKARHGADKHPPPSKTMSLAHARLLIDRILRAWLEWKARQHDRGASTS